MTRQRRPVTSTSPCCRIARIAALCVLALAVLMLAACGGRGARKGSASTAYPAGAGARAGVTPLKSGPNPCAVVVAHDERWYKRGGLYAPHLSDGGPAVPLDVANIPEPEPRAESRALYGNRSPYSVLGKRYHVMDDGAARRYVERGLASWYGTKFHGRKTSSLEPYDMCTFSAAHKTLPLPSYARVTNLENGRSVVVRVNDRGPFHAGRIIDLSYAAAVKLGVQQRGVAKVEVRALDGSGQRGWFARRRDRQERAATPASTSRRVAGAAPVPFAGVAGSGSAPARAAASAPVAATPFPVAAAPPPTAAMPLAAAPSSAAPFPPAHSAASSVAAAVTAPISSVAPAPLPASNVAMPPSTPTSAAAPARTWLQIGSFGERANADAAARRLQAAGLGPVEVAPIDVAGRALWRVRLGPLAAETAAGLAGRVAALGLGQPRLLSE